MDPKELKALLKEAKDCLKSKEFATAQKNCKLILKKVPDHYQANLFLGTSLKEQGKWGQAIESYKKAAEVDPNQVFAWQGILLTYEKQGDKTHPDLLDAYKRVASFYETDDKSKYIESTKKLAHVLISQEDGKGALKVLTRLGKSHGVDLEMAGLIEALLAGTKYDGRTPDQNQLYTQALATTVSESPKPSDDTFKKYFTQLNRSGSHDRVVAVATGVRDKWNFYSSPMEWLCRYYIEDRLDPVTLAQIGSFEAVTDKLFKLHPSSSFGHFARGKFLIDSGVGWNDGFSFLAIGLESNYNFHALKILIRGRLDYGDFERAVDDCTNGLRQFGKDPSICRLFRLYLAEAWISVDALKAEELLENVKDDLKEVQNQWIVLNIKLAAKKLDFEAVQKFLKLVEVEEKEGGGSQSQQHWAISFYRIMAGTDRKSPEGLKDAINAALGLVEDEPSRVQLQIEASILLFNLKFYKESADLLVALTGTTEAGRRRPIPWKYLGKLYSLQDDLDLASKCYRKAYKLCSSADVGALLSDTYFTLGKDDLNRELLIGATKAFIKSRSKWAWLRLGILYLHSGEANNAVTALQAAIRSDINDCHVWESLADAYSLRGSYSAALSTYNKALSLGADPLYSKLKIGVVYQCLGRHDESLETLKSLLKEYPDNCTPVLVELARTNSLIAQELQSENFDIRALAAVENSLAYAVLAILQSPRRILLPWKIIGESSLTLINLPEDTLVKVPSFLLGDNPQLLVLDPSKTISVLDFEYKQVSLDKLREIGIQAMLECLRVIETPQEDGTAFSQNLKAYVYHQLGLLYFHRARFSAKFVEAKASSDIYKKAITAAKKAVASNQTQYIFWNSLGVIAYFNGNPELAQHSFIKSLEIEANNVVAWCNLGMLYMKNDEPLLAHKMFDKAQSASPLHSVSWIGQGLVAEAIEPSQAPDLFRHASHLEPSPFGVACYTDWICRILLKEVTFSPTDYWYAIVRVDALTIVNDLITRVEARNRTPQLYNMKGIIAALNSFHTTALIAFTTALELARSNPTFCVSESELKQIVLNRIVMLVKLQRYEEAVEAFSTVENLDCIGFAVGALTTSKLGYLEQSEKLYSQLLRSLSLMDSSETNDQDKINVTIAQGLLLNQHRGPEAACNLLLQDFMVKSPHGLLALSAIGIMNGDADFLNSVMPHLDEFRHDDDVLPDIGLMKACFHIMSGNSKKGVHELLKLVRCNPLNARLWGVLSQIVFRHDEQQTFGPCTIRKITMTALKLSNLRGKGRVAETKYSMSSAMVSLCYLMSEDWKTAITTALKGIRQYPNERENWIVLACAKWYQFVETGSKPIYHILVSILEKELSLNRVHQRAEDWAKAFLHLVKSHAPK